MESLPEQATAYLAPIGFDHILKQTLGKNIVTQLGQLFICDTYIPGIYWAQNIWMNPKIILFQSISDAAKKLRAIQRDWANYSFQLHRRSHLITDLLPKLKRFPINFPEKNYLRLPLGSWTLLSQNTLLAATNCSSILPNGAAHFVENKIDPPSRAYLKLWEACTIINRYPKAGDICLDLGSSPGGWSWALSNLNAQVISVDRSPLALSIQTNPLVKFVQGSAFALEPSQFKHLDWIVSDLICYPTKSFDLLRKWLLAFPKANFIWTIKFQGETDHQTTNMFASIPGSHIQHLYHNKHELTWMKPADL